MSAVYDELARLGTATVYEASGRQGLLEVDLIQVIAGSRVAGPARTVRCAQDDNLMVHAAMASLAPGEVLVLTMPQPAPVALIGDLLMTQAMVRGAAGVLVDAAVRDVEELSELEVPVWTRWVRARGAAKEQAGAINETVDIGGVAIAPGDVIVLDADGGVAVPSARVGDVLEASRAREARETDKRAKLQAGTLSYDLDGLRERVRAQGRDAS